MAGIIVVFVLNYKTLSSRMAHISEHINSSNHKINYYDKMRKMIFNLVSKKGKNNDNYSPNSPVYIIYS